MPSTYGGEDSGWKPGKNPTIKVKRKNGVFQGWKSQSKANAKERAKKPKRDGRFSKAASFAEGDMRDSGYGHKPGKSGSRVSPPKNVAAAAGRRFPKRYYPTHAEYTDTNKRYFKNIKEGKTGDTKTSGEMHFYRQDRKNRGNFKGKYYGPDAFKGDLTMVDKWRAAGSPKNTKSFAKKAAVKRSTNRGD